MKTKEIKSAWVKKFNKAAKRSCIHVQRRVEPGGRRLHQTSCWMIGHFLSAFSGCSSKMLTKFRSRWSKRWRNVKSKTWRGAANKLNGARRMSGELSSMVSRVIHHEKRREIFIIRKWGLSRFQTDIELKFPVSKRQELILISRWEIFKKIQNFRSEAACFDNLIKEFECSPLSFLMES